MSKNSLKPIDITKVLNKIRASDPWLVNIDKLVSINHRINLQGLIYTMNNDTSVRV